MSEGWNYICSIIYTTLNMRVYKSEGGYSITHNTQMRLAYKTDYYPNNYGKNNDKNDTNRRHDTADDPLCLGKEEQTYKSILSCFNLMHTLTLRILGLRVAAIFKDCCPDCTYTAALSTLCSIRSIISPCSGEREERGRREGGEREERGRREGGEREKRGRREKGKREKRGRREEGKGGRREEGEQERGRSGEKTLRKHAQAQLSCCLNQECIGKSMTLYIQRAMKDKLYTHLLSSPLPPTLAVQVTCATGEGLGTRLAVYTAHSYRKAPILTLASFPGSCVGMRAWE